MSIGHETLGFLADVRAPWRTDWIWGCPLIVITVILHVLGLQWIGNRAIAVHTNFRKRAYLTMSSAAVIGTATLLATFLHGLEATIWALTYILIGALPDARSAMLYSLGALTTYGHQSVYLESTWRLLGAIEALNGWLLFGLSTAFLFWLMQEVSPKNHAGS
jgi:hypothetical protein